MSTIHVIEREATALHVGDRIMERCQNPACEGWQHVATFLAYDGDHYMVFDVEVERWLTFDREHGRVYISKSLWGNVPHFPRVLNVEVVV